MNTTFTTRNEAIDSIIETIEAGDATRDEFDIDAIADDVITTTGEGVDYRFHVTDDDAFWASVERHAL
jgi:hypothetical protein